MANFLWGLAVGLATALAVAALVGAALRRRLLRAQRRAKEAERMAELGTLTGGLAHEIKNPLSTVQLNLQLLQEDLPRESASFTRLAKRLATVERETARLREILDDFLRYAGRMELDPRPVELNGLCEELVDFFVPQAQLHRVQLRLQRAAEPITVMADERLLKQAVLNLMLNAVQAMPNGGELMLSIVRDEKEACIHIIDTGPGIEPEKVARIFDAYYSTKKSGTGLGLAMTRRIVDEHGGRVTVSSELGKGSDFAIHLPK